MRKTRTLHKAISHRSVPHVTKRSENGDTLRVAREKIIRVFRYLEALNQHRNPVQRQLSGQEWSLWLHDVPRHHCVQRGTTSTKPASGDAADKGGDANTANFVLKVRRPKLTSPPDPPREIAAWLKSGWDDPAKHAGVFETKEQSEGADC